MIKNIFCSIAILLILSSFKNYNNETLTNWKIQINDKIVTADNIKLELLSKNTEFKIEYLNTSKSVNYRFIEVVNKEGIVLKKYSFEGKDISQGMSFKADSFYDKLGEDEKLSIFYYEKGKQSKAGKIKLVEITF